MNTNQPSQFHLFLSLVFLMNGVVATGIAITKGGAFSAWYGGFMLMAGLAIFDRWRFQRKVADLEAEIALHGKVIAQPAA